MQRPPTLAARLGDRLHRGAGTLVRLSRAVPGLRVIALSQPVARVGYLVASVAGFVWGGALSVGEFREEHGVFVARGCPRWAFGRGGTTIGCVYLTDSNDTPAVLEHEAAHRAQWRRYGLAFVPLYLAAGPVAETNRFEREAGLDKGGYR